MIKIYLEKAAYDVVTASDREAAQETLLSEVACLIILDLMLPTIDGESFLCLGAGTKTNTADKINLLKLGANAYMTRPFVLGSLLHHYYVTKALIDSLQRLNNST